MGWIVLLPVCICVALTFSCSPIDDGIHARPDTDEDLVETQDPLVCTGECVSGPPATYTGPSLFWLGSPPMVPVCPVDTPHQGLEGYVDSDPMLPEYARECLITASDVCDVEGETCAPLGHEDYYLCIHKVGDGPCPTMNDYPIRKTMVDIDTDDTLRLCCRILPPK